MHIHAEKAEHECKYWIEAEGFNLREAFSYNMSPRDTRDVRRITFQTFDHLAAEWRRVHGNR